MKQSMWKNKWLSTSHICEEKAMEIKVITYNIDGLPDSIDLKTLPWYLKPVTWIYRLFKHTTIMPVNDNQNKAECIKEISRRLSQENADIIAVQEDFNYHTELMSTLSKIYNSGEYGGTISIDNLKFLPYPHFKADGLNLITKSKIMELAERIIPWKKSNGYISHANDKLATKGFRFYSLIMINGKQLNVYVVHMDADFYDPVKCPDVSKDVAARKSQFKQLADYIANYPKDVPTLILGDTNSYNKYQWDTENLNYFTSLLPDFKEAIPTNYSDCDRIFYRGLNLKSCHFDLSYHDENGTQLSDHKPLITIFEL